LTPVPARLRTMGSLPFRRSPPWPLRSLAILSSLAAAFSLLAEENDQRPAKGIQDNSFFIEEAYNQEPGVVQHILNIQHSVSRRAGPDDKEWSFVFTQEWPIGSQTHQFSYTVPYSFMETAGESDDGIGDVLINYRLQAFTESSSSPAFAPRFSLVLPTGDEARDLGNGVLGYQVNLPLSKILTDRWTLHVNAGLTFLPDVQGNDLINYNLGGSAIFAVSRDLNLMLECVASLDEETGGDRASSVIFSPGLRYAFNFKNDAQLVVGLAAPIGLSTAAPDYGAFLYFSFEHFFAR
jgi:outer membrane putative beta-barrel porin/alpha-amylase